MANSNGKGYGTNLPFAVRDVVSELVDQDLATVEDDGVWLTELGKTIIQRVLNGWG
jgi:hypothetical protein